MFEKGVIMLYSWIEKKTAQAAPCVMCSNSAIFWEPEGVRDESDLVFVTSSQITSSHWRPSVFLAAINITRARFGGGGQFGYTSFAAHSSLPSFTFFYEFRLQFTLANNATDVRDNLVLFAGHKGQGEAGSRRPERAERLKLDLNFITSLRVFIWCYL